MLHVLVIEDDRDVATELIYSLQLLGHDASWSSAQTPLLVASNCDIVLLDLGLGTTDGFQVLEQLAALPMAPPIAIISGQDGRFIETASDLAKARGLRIAGLLAKPVTPRQVDDVLKSLKGPKHLPRSISKTIVALEPFYVFQYKNDLKTGAPVGCEVLVRLPGIGDIAAWFASLDQDRAFAMTISAAAAAIELRLKLERRGEPLPIAFNCPPDTFCAPEFLVALRQMCDRANVSPRSIAIELTEQQGHSAPLDLSSMACRYALAGFAVHLDDFGTGMAGFDQLLKLPLSEVKIDRALFRRLMRDGKGLLLEITTFCRTNNIRSTIEGIETPFEMKVARMVGADYGQGFFWSRPTPITALPLVA